MQGSKEQSALRTRVYIDGYNLYYGCLKRSLHKWLDPRALIECILPTILYEQGGVPVRYRFKRQPSNISPRQFSKPSQNPTIRRRAKLTITRARRAAAERAPDHQGLSRREAGTCASLGRREARAGVREIDIWKLEEKQSDVALALHAYSDAIRNEVDQIVVLTNDTDFVPAMRMIRDHTSVIVGLIAPLRQDRGTVNAGIERHAHWARKYIRDEEFAHSQLPHRVQCKNGAIHKPITWYPRPDLLMPIYEEAKRVKRSAGGARKWLNQPCAHLGHRVPIEMCSEDKSARELRAYMDCYAREFDDRSFSLSGENR